MEHSRVQKKRATKTLLKVQQTVRIREEELPTRESDERLLWKPVLRVDGQRKLRLGFLSLYIFGLAVKCVRTLFTNKVLCGILDTVLES